MSSISLERYKSRHPSEREAITRLETLLGDGKERRLTFNRLAELLNANSEDELALVLGELAAAGIVEYALEVRSPRTNEPLRNFHTLAEIPAVLHDATTDIDFTVTPDDVSAVYALPGTTRR